MKKELFNYVHELLSQKEYIIVPNFGAFVLQKTTTFLNDGEYISIIFSAQQQNDDKVLSTYIAEKNACSIDESDEFIEQTLEAIYSEIEQKGTYKIEGIGEFRAINERIVFKPFEEQFLLDGNANDTKEQASSIEKAEIKEEIVPEPIPEPKVVEAPITPPVDVKREERNETKVDIETIRQTYAERALQPKKEEETKTEEKTKEQEKVKEPILSKEKKAIDFSKFKTPAIIVIVIALLGIAGYVFRAEIASLCKPTQTNDTTSVIIQQNLNQLADTLQEIQNTPESEMSITEEITSSQPEVTVPENVDTNLEVASSPSTRTYYGNTNETKYYVTKASYSVLSDAKAEKNNLDYTGFIASIVETDGAKKYHVVIGEFNTMNEAVNELKFAKEIDKRFFLMTVKPRNK